MRQQSSSDDNNENDTSQSATVVATTTTKTPAVNADGVVIVCPDCDLCDGSGR